MNKIWYTYIQSFYQDGIQPSGPISDHHLFLLLDEHNVLTHHEHGVKVHGGREEPCGGYKGQWLHRLGTTLVRYRTNFQNLPVTRIVEQLLEAKSSKVTEDYKYFDPKMLRVADR